MQPNAVLEAVLYADDLEAARHFYTEVLGLTLFHADRRQVFCRCGEQMVLVFDPAITAAEPSSIDGAPIPLHGARGPGHLALRVEPDHRRRWVAHLEEQNVAIESVVDWPGGGWSLYMRDPAGNSVELATASVWRRSDASD